MLEDFSHSMIANAGGVLGLAIAGFVVVSIWRAIEYLVIVPIVGPYFGMAFLFGGYFLDLCIIGACGLLVIAAVFNPSVIGEVSAPAIGALAFALLVLRIPENYTYLISKRGRGNGDGSAS